MLFQIHIWPWHQSLIGSLWSVWALIWNREQALIWQKIIAHKCAICICVCIFWCSHPSLFCFHVCSKGSNGNPKYAVSVLVQVVSDRVSAVPDGSEQVNSATWARPSKYGTVAADCSIDQYQYQKDQYFITNSGTRKTETSTRNTKDQ